MLSLARCGQHGPLGGIPWLIGWALIQQPIDSLSTLGSCFLNVAPSQGFTGGFLSPSPPTFCGHTFLLFLVGRSREDVSTNASLESPPAVVLLPPCRPLSSYYSTCLCCLQQNSRMQYAYVAPTALERETHTHCQAYTQVPALGTCGFLQRCCRFYRTC